MRIVVAETIAEEGIDLLREYGEVDVAAGLDRSDLLARLADADVRVVRSATGADARVLDAAPAPGEDSSMMGISFDRAPSAGEVDGVRALDINRAACFVELGIRRG
jgi:hypothetical protein